MFVTLRLRIGKKHIKTLYTGEFGNAIVKLNILTKRPIPASSVLEDIFKHGEFALKGRARLHKGTLTYFTPKARHKGEKRPPHHTGWYDAELTITPETTHTRTTTR